MSENRDKEYPKEVANKLKDLEAKAKEWGVVHSEEREIIKEVEVDNPQLMQINDEYAIEIDKLNEMLGYERDQKAKVDEAAKILLAEDETLKETNLQLVNNAVEDNKKIDELKAEVKKLKTSDTKLKKALSEITEE